jgi:hypothetical protein
VIEIELTDFDKNEKFTIFLHAIMIYCPLTIRTCVMGDEVITTNLCRIKTIEGNYFDAKETYEEVKELITQAKVNYFLCQRLVSQKI